MVFLNIMELKLSETAITVIAMTRCMLVEAFSAYMDEIIYNVVRYFIYVFLVLHCCLLCVVQSYSQGVTALMWHFFHISNDSCESCILKEEKTWKPSPFSFLFIKLYILSSMVGHNTWYITSQLSESWVKSFWLTIWRISAVIVYLAHIVRLKINTYLLSILLLSNWGNI